MGKKLKYKCKSHYHIFPLFLLLLNEVLQFFVNIRHIRLNPLVIHCEFDSWWLEAYLRLCLDLALHGEVLVIKKERP